MFNTLKARDLYNEVLKFAVDLLLQFGVNLRVLHISREFSTITNCLSHGQLTQAQSIWPALFILSYQPLDTLVEAVTL